MTARERNLLVVFLGILAVLIGYFGLNRFFFSPLREAGLTLAQLEEEVGILHKNQNFTSDELKFLSARRTFTLPKNVGQGVVAYNQYLQGVLISSGLSDVQISSSVPPESKSATPQKKGTPLTFQVSQARGDLASVSRALAKIQQTPLLHRVKSMSLNRVDGATKETTPKLLVTMTVEALILPGAEERQELLTVPPRVAALEGVLAWQRAPIGIPTVTWSVLPGGPMYTRLDAPKREYADISKRNFFVGAIPAPPPPPPPPPPIAKPVPPRPTPPDESILQHIRLTSTTPTSKEATLRNRVSNPSGPEQRLRAVTRSGFDTFRIFDDNGLVVVKGKVLRIDQRDVYFLVDDEIYGIHIGQSMAEALKRPLEDKEIDELKLKEKEKAP